jgi:hypothetical protein
MFADLWHKYFMANKPYKNKLILGIKTMTIQKITTEPTPLFTDEPVTIKKSVTVEKQATLSQPVEAVKASKPATKSDDKKTNTPGLVKPKPVKSVEKQATPVKIDETIHLPTVKSLRDEKAIVQLNHIYGQLNAGARPVFGQTRFTPIKAPHVTLSATKRDDAFFRAIKAVYGTKPFTQYEIGADTGNMARSLGMKRIELTGESDDLGHAYYRLVA